MSKTIHNCEKEKSNQTPNLFMYKGDTGKWKPELNVTIYIHKQDLKPKLSQKHKWTTHINPSSLSLKLSDPPDSFYLGCWIGLGLTFTFTIFGAFRPHIFRSVAARGFRHFNTPNEINSLRISSPWSTKKVNKLVKWPRQRQINQIISFNGTVKVKTQITNKSDRIMKHWINQSTHL